MALKTDYIKQWILLLLIFGAPLLHAQNKPVVVSEYASTDKKALLIPDSLTRNTGDIALYIRDHFASEKERVRAIFVWIAHNIEYDIANMYAIDFYGEAAEKIAKPLRTRKGICENYAALFDDVCGKLGIPSYVVTGYVKESGAAANLSHAWCVAFIDSAWFVFDPTWGSGYIREGKFYKKINNAYFRALPSVIIRSHMPFDYLWQFLHYPVTGTAFMEGKVQQDTTKPYFNFTDSIRVYEQQDTLTRLAACARRIEQNGVNHSLVFDYLRHVKMDLEIRKQNAAAAHFNASAALFNEAVNDFNDFVNYRNKQFNPMKTDPEIQSMLTTVAGKLKAAREKMELIKTPDANTSALIIQLSRSADEIDARLKEQQGWLTTYFSKGKSGRRSMFYERRLSLFGIPVNK